MRRIVVVAVATLAFALTLPASNVDAVCEPPPDAGTAAGIRTMRSTQAIVWGTIVNEIPADAHGQHSFFLRVRGYFRGSGAATIEIADLADGDLPAEALRPGASVPATEEFLGRFGGQDAVVFAARDTVPYVGQFTTGICTYTAYGDAASADILPLLRRVFGAPQPPRLSQSGPAELPALSVLGIAMTLLGAAFRFVARRGLSSRRPEPLAVLHAAR